MDNDALNFITSSNLSLHTVFRLTSNVHLSIRYHLNVRGRKLDYSWLSGRLMLSKVIKLDKTVFINSLCQHLHLEVIWIFTVTLSVLIGWAETLTRVKAVQCSLYNAL